MAGAAEARAPVDTKIRCCFHFRARWRLWTGTTNAQKWCTTTGRTSGWRCQSTPFGGWRHARGPQAARNRSSALCSLSARKVGAAPAPSHGNMLASTLLVRCPTSGGAHVLCRLHKAVDEGAICPGSAMHGSPHFPNVLTSCCSIAAPLTKGWVPPGVERTHVGAGCSAVCCMSASWLKASVCLCRLHPFAAHSAQPVCHHSERHGRPTPVILF